MNPISFLVVALCSPLLFAVVLLVPIYAGIAGADYIIYAHGATTNPLLPHLGDVLYMVDVYHQLFIYWQGRMGAVSMLHYSLPLIGLPLIGLLVAFWLTRSLARGLRHLFHARTL